MPNEITVADATRTALSPTRLPKKAASKLMRPRDLPLEDQVTLSDPNAVRAEMPDFRKGSMKLSIDAAGVMPRLTKAGSVLLDRASKSHFLKVKNPANMGDMVATDIKASLAMENQTLSNISNREVRRVGDYIASIKYKVNPDKLHKDEDGRILDSLPVDTIYDGGFLDHPWKGR